MGILLAICPFLIGGSRGPVIALIISLLLVFAIKTKLFINRKHLKYVLLIILILVLGVATFGDVAFARLSNLLDDIASKSQDVKRIWIWETAFKQFLRSPVIGDSIQIEGVDYPHNLILEVLMSTGLIGFIPFFTLIIYGIYRSIQIIKNSKSLVWVCIFFYQSFMMGMISGNVYSSIWFWSSLAMVLSADLSTEDKYNT